MQMRTSVCIALGALTAASTPQRVQLLLGRCDVIFEFGFARSFRLLGQLGKAYDPL
ncbi:MAG: hypothetical protein ABIR33_02605 [Pyrinomonadaceae bacterium]